jgi:hypothetical protein
MAKAMKWPFDVNETPFFAYLGIGIYVIVLFTNDHIDSFKLLLHIVRTLRLSGAKYAWVIPTMPSFNWQSHSGLRSCLISTIPRLNKPINISDESLDHSMCSM